MTDLPPELKAMNEAIRMVTDAMFKPIAAAQKTTTPALASVSGKDSESVASELYNAALEALDDDDAHKSYDPNPRLPERLREALRAWTDMEYREHLESK